MTMTIGWKRLAALFLALLLSVPAAYALDTDEPLAEGEGWLAVLIDNDADVSSVRFDGPGLFGDGLVKDLGDGRNVRVLRAKAGKYRWSMLNRPSPHRNLAGEYFNVRRDAQYEFTVEAGKLNYPGNFIVKSTGLRSIVFYRSNRALQAMMGLDHTFPGLRGRYPWRNDFNAPDPFEEFAAATLKPDSSAALLASGEADARKTAAGAVDEKFADAFNDVYAPPRAYWPVLSPDGQRLAFKERRGDNQVAVVVDLTSGETLDLLTVLGDVNDLAWGGNRGLYVGVAVDTAKVVAAVQGKSSTVPMALASGLEFVRFGEGKLAAGNLTRLRLPGAIWLVNPLYEDGDSGIVARIDSRGEAHVFAFDETARGFDVKDFRSERRLDKGIEDAYAFFADATGALRGAFVAGKGGTHSLAARADDGTWTVHPPLPDNTDLRAVSLSADGKSLVVLTNFEREQVEMATLDLQTGRVGATLIAEPGADLIGAVIRTRDRAVIGANFFRDGILQTRFLPGDDEKLLAGVAKQFPDANVAVWDDSLDGKRLVLRVSSETDPGGYYLFDRDQRRLEKLIDVYDPFKHVKPVTSSVFTVKAADGLAVEAFLSLPAGVKGNAPLVVMPHGGPIGASDRRVFDPSVQMLASSGFAVLRVNYRGSGGSGRAFEQAGYGKWGREIEADVALALDHALAKFPLDRDRVALWGASYGGYSALMGLIREPDRYRCAVAIAAVTDLPLLFSSSDWTRDAKNVARMKRIVGDPDTALAELREYSPAYQFQRLKKPLMLIHGMDDARVSFEHSWRLRSLLAASGSPPAWLPLPGADHSLSRIKDRLAMHAASDGFLRECLAPAAAGSAVSAAAQH